MLRVPPAPQKRPNAREIAAGVAVSVAIVLAASAAVFLFELHPAVMIFGMILGSSLGMLQARRMTTKRITSTGDSRKAEAATKR